jgi:hypothetical protein
MQPFHGAKIKFGAQPVENKFLIVLVGLPQVCIFGAPFKETVSFQIPHFSLS